MYRLLLPVFCFTLILTACLPSKEEREKGLLPQSSGGMDEVLVVIDKKYENDSIGKIIRRAFQSSYPKLPQDEVQFGLSMVSYGEMNELLKHFRHMLVVGSADGKGSTADFIRESLGDRLDGLDKPLSKSFKEVWAKDQKVHFLVAPTAESLEATVEAGMDEILAVFSEAALLNYRRIALTNGTQQEFSRELERYGLSMDLPADYRKVHIEDNFLWMRKDEAGIISNVVVSIFDAPEDSVFRNAGIAIRHAYGEKYVESSIEGDYMVSDTFIGYDSRAVTIGGMPGFENRGLWAMKDAFMGGPFVNYYLHDTLNNRAIFAEGFVFAPSKKKKPHMRTLESLLYTMRTAELQ